MGPLKLLPFKSIASFLLLASVAVGITACSPERISTGKKEARTGGMLSDGREYTGAGESDRLSKLKTEIPQTDGANFRLASAIKGISVQKFDRKGVLVAEFPDRLAIRVDFADSKVKPVIIDAELKTDASGTHAKAPGDRFDSEVACTDSKCDLIELKLSGNFEGKPARAGVLHRVRSLRAELKGDAQSMTALKDLTKHLESSGVYTTTEVTWGRSDFKFEAEDFCVSGALVTTDVLDEPAVLCGKTPYLKKAELMGNDNRGGVLIRLTGDSVRALLHIRTDLKPNEVAPELPQVPHGPKFIPYDENHPITQEFQRDRNNLEIRKRIELARTSKRFLSFLARVRPNLPVLVHALAEKSVPVETLFLTYLESGYFTRPDFPIDISPVGAVGPWQFMAETAKKDLGLQVFPVENGVVNPCDDRADLEKSTQGAATYLRTLFKRYPHDPKLAIMAYNWGMGNVDRHMQSQVVTDRLKDLDDAGVDFWVVRDLNIAPMESLNYVVDFLAAQFVGREPKAFGIEVPPASEYPATVSRCAKD